MKDPVLRKNVTPGFTVGCKRILFANNYYPALQAANTRLIPHGLVKVEGNPSLQPMVNVTKWM